MATVIAPFGFTLRDSRGQVGRVGWHYRYDDASTSAGDALATVLSFGPMVHALSNAALVGGYGLTAKVLNPNQYGATTTYSNVEDKARVVSLDTDFALRSWSIPAPKSTLFQADQETVNFAAGGFPALLVALLAVDSSGGVACAKTGAPFALAGIAGMRTRRRFQRRITLWSLTPNESGPDE